MKTRVMIWTSVVILFTSASFAGVPKSERSRLAVSWARPVLEEQMTAKGLRLGSKVFVRIFKDSRELEVWVEKGERYVLFKTYPICHFSGYVGPKKRRGDHQAPEGIYSLNGHSLNPMSTYHLSMDVGYPNSYDRANGRTGSAIMIHGDCVSIGCFAMTDAGIDQIYTIIESALESGQNSIPLHIFPFRMTVMNMVRYIRFPDHAFWREIRPVYSAFEETHQPPKVNVEKGKYVLVSE